MIDWNLILALLTALVVGYNAYRQKQLSDDLTTVKTVVIPIKEDVAVVKTVVLNGNNGGLPKSG